MKISHIICFIILFILILQDDSIFGQGITSSSNYRFCVNKKSVTLEVGSFGQNSIIQTGEIYINSDHINVITEKLIDSVIFDYPYVGNIWGIEGTLSFTVNKPFPANELDIVLLGNDRKNVKILLKDINKYFDKADSVIIYANSFRQADLKYYISSSDPFIIYRSSFDSTKALKSFYSKCYPIYEQSLLNQKSVAQVDSIPLNIFINEALSRKQILPTTGAINLLKAINPILRGSGLVASNTQIIYPTFPKVNFKTRWELKKHHKFMTTVNSNSTALLIKATIEFKTAASNFLSTEMPKDDINIYLTRSRVFNAYKACWPISLFEEKIPYIIAKELTSYLRESTKLIISLNNQTNINDSSYHELIFLLNSFYTTLKDFLLVSDDYFYGFNESHSNDLFYTCSTKTQGINFISDITNSKKTFNVFDYFKPNITYTGKFNTFYFLVWKCPNDFDTCKFIPKNILKNEKLFKRYKIFYKSSSFSRERIPCQGSANTAYETFSTGPKLIWAEPSYSTEEKQIKASLDCELFGESTGLAHSYQGKWYYIIQLK